MQTDGIQAEIENTYLWALCVHARGGRILDHAHTMSSFILGCAALVIYTQ